LVKILLQVKRAKILKPTKRAKVLRPTKRKKVLKKRIKLTMELMRMVQKVIQQILIVTVREPQKIIQDLRPELVDWKKDSILYLN